jgi:hypothetical protein
MPQHPIEMQISRREVFGKWQWVLGLGVLTLWLFSQEGGWRLLAWPAGILAVVLVGVALLTAWSGAGTQLSADPEGLKIDDRVAVRTIAWRQVSRVVLEERWTIAT